MDNYLEENQLAIESKAFLSIALMLLLKKESYKKITIADICHKAGLSRTTFYNHFNTKEDVVLHYLDTLNIVPPSSDSGRAPGKEHALSVTDYVFNNRDTFELLLNNNLDFLVEKTLLDKISNYTTTYFLVGKDKKTQYGVAFMSGAITALIISYIRNKDHMTREEFSELLYQFATGTILDSFVATYRSNKNSD